MSNGIPEEREQDSPLIDTTGHIQTAEEIDARTRAEEQRQEKHYRKLLLEAETRQANASRAIVKLTFGLVFVSLVSGIVSFFQFKAADRSVRTMEDQAFITALTVGQTQHMIGQAIEQTRAAQQNAVGAIASADAAKSAANTAALTLQQIREDQRPYVVVTGMKDRKPLISAGHPITWDVQAVNYGKSLAAHVTMSFRVSFGSDTNSDIDRFFGALPKRSVGTRVIIPMLGKGDINDPSFLFTTITSYPFAPSQEAVDFIKIHDFAIAAMGRLWYGGAHYSDFCFQTLVSGAVTLCENHNEIH